LACDFDGRLVARFFLAVKVPLQLDVNVLAPENLAECMHARRARFRSSSRKRVRQRPFRSARKAEQAAGMFRHFFRRNAAFSFARSQFHPGNQPAKIPVSGARSGQ